MDLEIFRLAASQSLWAVLFVTLLGWTLKENSRREKQYQDTLEGLTAKITLLQGIEAKLDRIDSALLSAELFWQQHHLYAHVAPPYPAIHAPASPYQASAMPPPQA